MVLSELLAKLLMSRVRFCTDDLTSAVCPGYVFWAEVTRAFASACTSWPADWICEGLTEVMALPSLLTAPLRLSSFWQTAGWEPHAEINIAATAMPLSTETNLILEGREFKRKRKVPETDSREAGRTGPTSRVECVRNKTEPSSEVEVRGRFSVARLIAAVLTGGVVLAACGGGSDSAATDEAFVTWMVPHHESAIAMAELAQDQAEHKEIQELANEIVKSQSREIDQMLEIRQRLGVSGDHAEMHGDDGGMGLSAEEMGMGMGMMAESIDGEVPFDRAFIDAMIPHHQGAIRMARAELARGSDPEVEALARSIIEAQTAEIALMNAWRLEWYGARSPAGGGSGMHMGHGSGAAGMEHMGH